MMIITPATPLGGLEEICLCFKNQAVYNNNNTIEQHFAYKHLFQFISTGVIVLRLPSFNISIVYARYVLNYLFELSCKIDKMS